MTQDRLTLTRIAALTSPPCLPVRSSGTDPDKGIGTDPASNGRGRQAAPLRHGSPERMSRRNGRLTAEGEEFMGRRGAARPPPSFPKTSSPSPGKSPDLGKPGRRPGEGDQGGGGAVADRAWALQVTAYEPCVNGIHSQSLSAVEGRLFDCDLHGRLQENQSGSDPSQTPVSCSAGLRSLAQPARAGRVLEGLGLRPRPPLL